MAKVVQPNQNIPFLPLEDVSQTSRHGAQFFSNVKQLQVGYGAEVFRVDRDGMWAGAEDFASAPWSVDWEGNMTANSVTLSGYLEVGDALNDIGAGNITGTYIANGAIVTDKLAANAVTATKINVSSLSAISANIGTVTAGSITGVTITGGTVQTDSTGFRTVLGGGDDRIKFMSGGTVYASIRPYVFAQGNGMNAETLSGDAFLFIQEGTTNAAGIGISGVYGMFIEPNDIQIYGDVTINDDLDVDGTLTVGSFAPNSLSMGGNIDMNGFDIIDVDDITCDDINADVVACDILDLDGGGYVDEARAFYFEQGRTTNPSISGEMRYYDGGSKGFRGHVNGFTGQFDLSSV